MGSKFHGGKRGGLDRAVMKYIAEWYTPRMIASFALVLYDNTDIPKEDIAYLCSECDKLWRRAEKEGWDILENCEELTDIKVKHITEAVE